MCVVFESVIKLDQRVHAHAGANHGNLHHSSGVNLGRELEESSLALEGDGVVELSKLVRRIAASSAPD